MDGREHEVEATYGATTGEPIWTTCRCHSSHVYASLVNCPKCGHRSFDPWAESCERRKCGYEVITQEAERIVREFQRGTGIAPPDEEGKRLREAAE